MTVISCYSIPIFLKINLIQSLQVTVWENVCWKELGLLCFVWIAFLVLQISKVMFILLYLWFKYFQNMNYLGVTDKIWLLVTESYSYLYSSILGVELIAGTFHVFHLYYFFPFETWFKVSFLFSRSLFRLGYLFMRQLVCIKDGE